MASRGIVLCLFISFCLSFFRGSSTPLGVRKDIHVLFSWKNENQRMVAAEDIVICLFAASASSFSFRKKKIKRRGKREDTPFFFSSFQFYFLF